MLEGEPFFTNFGFRTSFLVMFHYFHKSSLCFGHFCLSAWPAPSEGRYLENLIYHGTQLDTINEAVGLAQVTGRGSMFSSASDLNLIQAASS